VQLAITVEENIGSDDNFHAMCSETLTVIREGVESSGERRRLFPFGATPFELPCSPDSITRAAILLYTQMDRSCHELCEGACYVQTVQSAAVFADGRRVILMPDSAQFEEVTEAIKQITDPQSGARLDVALNDQGRGPCYPTAVSPSVRTRWKCLPEVATRDLSKESGGWMLDSPWRADNQLPDGATSFEVTYETCLLCLDGPARANAMGCQTWMWRRQRGSSRSEISPVRSTAWPSEQFSRALALFGKHRRGGIQTLRVYSAPAPGEGSRPQVGR
jgi:hypothetical protein